MKTLFLVTSVIALSKCIVPWLTHRSDANINANAPQKENQSAGKTPVGGATNPPWIVVKDSTGKNLDLDYAGGQ